MDTVTTIMSSWDYPGNMYDGPNIANSTSATNLDLNIASVQTADTGVYTCSANVTDSTDSVYVVHSALANGNVSIIVSK